VGRILTWLLRVLGNIYADALAREGAVCRCYARTVANQRNHRVVVYVDSCKIFIYLYKSRTGEIWATITIAAAAASLFNYFDY